MKKNAVMFLMLVAPRLCLGHGGDACVSPAEYTIDRRCYVTNEQKQKYPFNTVVGLVDKHDNIFCTGTIVEFEDSLYVFTAAHCVDHNGDKLPDNTINIKLQDGRHFTVNKTTVSNYFDKPKITDEEMRAVEEWMWELEKRDWAIYKFQQKDVDSASSIPFTNPTRQLKIDIHRDLNLDYDATSVGYGTLKIMSDQDIDNFKQSYINFLQKQALPSEKKRGNMNEEAKKTLGNIEQYRTDATNASYELRSELGFKDGGIRMNAPAVLLFLATNKELYKNTFHDTHLKVSYCNFVSNGLEKNCQSWGGNSGGSVFDRSGNLMGIHTEGTRIVGGPRHANSSGAESLLKTIPWRNNSIVDSVNHTDQK